MIPLIGFCYQKRHYQIQSPSSLQTAKYVLMWEVKILKLCFLVTVASEFSLLLICLLYCQLLFSFLTIFSPFLVSIL